MAGGALVSEETKAPSGKGEALRMSNIKSFALGGLDRWSGEMSECPVEDVPGPLPERRRSRAKLLENGLGWRSWSARPRA